MTKKNQTWFWIDLPAEEDPKEWAKHHCDTYNFDYSFETQWLLVWSLHDNDPKGIKLENLLKNDGIEYRKFRATVEDVFGETYPCCLICGEMSPISHVSIRNSKIVDLHARKQAQQDFDEVLPLNDVVCASHTLYEVVFWNREQEIPKYKNKRLLLKVEMIDEKSNE